MINKKLMATLEAVLFAAAEPISAAKLSSSLQVDELAIEENLSCLKTKYDDEQSGLVLLKLDDEYQLSTKTQYAPQIKAVLQQKRNTPLSQAAMEVLSIVAYKQPVTKAYIEQIRGVDCSGVIGSLCARDLICEAGRLDLPGRPLIYKTTSNFLRCFCLESLADLPAAEVKPE